MFKHVGAMRSSGLDLLNAASQPTRAKAARCSGPRRDRGLVAETASPSIAGPLSGQSYSIPDRSDREITPVSPSPSVSLTTSAIHLSLLRMGRQEAEGNCLPQCEALGEVAVRAAD